MIAYAGLFRDEYPPFRLDQGGADAGTEPPSAAGTDPAFPDAAGSLLARVDVGAFGYRRRRGRRSSSTSQP